MIPDMEKLAGDWLRTHPDVVALDARVATRTPDRRKMSMPWVRITQLDAANDPLSPADHVISYLIQLDCYAGDEAMAAHVGQSEASDLTRTVRQALTEMPTGDHVGAVVNHVRFTGMVRMPDTFFEPARERYVLTADIVAHEVVGVGS